ncbi:MAG: FecR domain-containing protein, partial [Burkholderiales bacterium]
MKAVNKVVLATVLALLAGSAAAEYAGIVKTSKGAALVRRAGIEIALTPGVQVNPGDRIVTGIDGYVGITMRDDTLLTLGPSSALNLDSYGFDAQTHDGNFLASLSKGVMSVVTGLIAKRSPESFVVRTRVSTIGVHGT